MKVFQYGVLDVRSAEQSARESGYVRAINLLLHGSAISCSPKPFNLNPGTEEWKWVPKSLLLLLLLLPPLLLPLLKTGASYTLAAAKLGLPATTHTARRNAQVHHQRPPNTGTQLVLVMNHNTGTQLV